MAHILFASPGIRSFHLHDRVSRLLVARGHQITILSADPHQQAFYRAQGSTVSALSAGRSKACRLPTHCFAEIDLLLGRRRPDAASLVAATGPLDRISRATVRFFEQVPADLLWIHGARGGLHRLLHFVARESGVAVLHTGEGLLPGTLQVDSQGLDGDAAAARRTAGDYRDTHHDDLFLSSALASWLSGSRAAPLSRNPVSPPPWRMRLLASCRSLFHRGPVAPADERNWRAALPPLPTPFRAPCVVPERPFVVLILQSATCQRRLLDAPWISDATLFTAAADAVKALDPRLSLLVLMPPSGLEPGVLAALQQTGRSLVLRPHDTARTLLPAALACITINDPLGASALLCFTPVVQLGRSLHGVPSVVEHCLVDQLEEALRRAIDCNPQILRGRMLTRLLRDEHIWCSPTNPDHNGLLGVIDHFERALTRRAGSGGGAGVRYRPGPSWPLSPPIS